MRKSSMELREQFLKSNWAKKLYRSEIKRGMLPNQRFVDYTNHVIYYNIILKGTANHSDDAKLHDTLSHNMSEGLVNKLDTLTTDEHMRVNDIVSLNMWVCEVETVDCIWKADVKNTANVMNEVMNRHNWEDTCNTPCQPDHRNNNELPSRNENHDENHYHPYCSHSDRADHDRNDRERNQDCRYKYCKNDHSSQNHGYMQTRDNNRIGQEHTQTR